MKEFKGKLERTTYGILDKDGFASCLQHLHHTHSRQMDRMKRQEKRRRKHESK